MTQSELARPPQVRWPIAGAVGLMLILAYPLGNLIVGMGVVLVPAPRALGVLGAGVLLAGTALVAVAGLPAPARRWIAGGVALAGLTLAAALVPHPELGLSPARIVLAGASLATLSWGMRCWLRAAGDGRGVAWWTVKAALEVVAAATMTLVGPLDPEPSGSSDVALATAFLAAVVALTRLGVHVGAIATGLQAFDRAAAAPARRATASASPDPEPASPAPATAGRSRHALSRSSRIRSRPGRPGRRKTAAQPAWSPPSTRAGQP